MIGVDCFNIIKALVVRFFLALHTVLVVWRVTENLDDTIYWLLCCLMIPFALEGLFNVIRRGGREYLWFSPCFFLYLCATLPPIWLLELDKSRKVREGVNETEQIENPVLEGNSTGTLDLGTDQIPINISLNPNMWTIVVEEMLLYLLVIGRWILPRGEVTREQLAEILFAFIGIAADVMEFFSLFGEEDVRKDRVLGYCLLGIWTLSILQFTMSVTVTQQPKRAKKIKVIEAELTKEDERRKMRNELFAIFLSMIMQDVPFLTLRLYTIITYNLINYSLIFFTSKNVLVISLLFYKIAVIIQKAYYPDPEEGTGDEPEKVLVGQGGGGDNAKYALDYEFAAGMPPVKSLSCELTHRKTSKQSSPASSNKSKSNKSDTKLSPTDSNSSRSNMTSAGSPHTPESPGTPGSTAAPSNGHASLKQQLTVPDASSRPQSLTTSPSSTVPNSGPGSKISSPVSSSDAKSLSSGERQKTPSDEQGSPRKETDEPVICNPELQDAKPGDPEFKPYVSVLKF